MFTRDSLELMDRDDLIELVIKLQEELNREREECAKLCEGEQIIMDGRPARRGPKGAGTWYEDSPLGAATRAIASAIRSRSVFEEVCYVTRVRRMRKSV